MIAGTCNVTVCYWYSPQTGLLLALLILVMVAITGAVATQTASRRRPRTSWSLALGAATVLGVLGPIVSLWVFRYDPNQFFTVATVLFALVPVAALTYSFGVARHSL